MTPDDYPGAMTLHTDEPLSRAPIRPSLDERPRLPWWVWVVFAAAFGAACFLAGQLAAANTLAQAAVCMEGCR
jgi:hypothetical protein